MRRWLLKFKRDKFLVLQSDKLGLYQIFYKKGRSGREGVKSHLS